VQEVTRTVSIVGIADDIVGAGGFAGASGWQHHRHQYSNHGA
jgi:hypothetical protein